MVMYGIAVSIGYFTGIKIVEVASDPVKRANAKRRFKNVKNALTGKDE